MDSDRRNRRCRRLGSPIRKSPDHRLCASPRSLSQLTTSFFAYLRLGIPTHALSSLTIKSISDTEHSRPTAESRIKNYQSRPGSAVGLPHPIAVSSPRWSRGRGPGWANSCLMPIFVFKCQRSKLLWRGRSLTVAAHTLLFRGLVERDPTASAGS